MCISVGEKSSAGIVEAAWSSAGPCPAGRGSRSAEAHDGRSRWPQDEHRTGKCPAYYPKSQLHCEHATVFDSPVWGAQGGESATEGAWGNLGKNLCITLRLFLWQLIHNIGYLSY